VDWQMISATTVTVRSMVTLTLLVLITACSAGGTGDAEAPPTTSESGIVATSTPTASATGPLTGTELAWLEAASKIADQTEKAVGPGDIYVTPKKLRSLQKALRICSGELKRIGAPTERLQPVYTLVKKACAEYDKGAACFATAAGYGSPYSGTSADRKQNAAINCGLDALGDGGTLMNDALNKAEEIKAATG
jgi:hypothetical protein